MNDSFASTCYYSAENCQNSELIVKTWTFLTADIFMRFFFSWIRHYFAENWQTSRLIVKKYELLLLLIFFKCMIFFAWMYFILQNNCEIHSFSVLSGDFFDQSASNFWRNSLFITMKLKIGIRMQKRNLCFGAVKTKITLL